MYSALTYYLFTYLLSRSQWPRRLRRRSTAALPLRVWVRIPPGAWKFVSCECCVLSGRGLCDELITRPEESYPLWRVVVCDQETSKEEAKARERAVNTIPQWVVMPREKKSNAVCLTSSHIVPFLNIPFSVNLRLRSSFTLTDQISQPHKKQTKFSVSVV